MKRVILGANPGAYGGGYGLWVSKPGKDAASAAQEDFLVAPGLNNALAILTGVFAAGATLALQSQGTEFNKSLDSYGDYLSEIPCIYGAYVNHSLGFSPIMWSDINYALMSVFGPGDYYQLPATAGTNGDPSYFDQTGFYVAAYVDATKVGIEMHGNMIVYEYYGSSAYVFPLASSVTLNLALHYAVLNAQVA
jgi:hypothetical protein